MITEDYVSHETAKLLKEKGFIYHNCHTAYDKDGVFFLYGDYSKDRKGVVDAPTLQMVMKWLREVHKIFISIFPTLETDMITSEDYNYAIYKGNAVVYQTCCVTYEEGCEAAIKYCLENLI